MKKTPLFVLAALLTVCSTGASAQVQKTSFDDSVSAGLDAIKAGAAAGRKVAASATAAEVAASAAQQGKVTAQGAPKEYARTIDCSAPKDAGLGDLRFYTYLDKKAPSKPASDDTASGLNDYKGSSLRDGKWHYDAWSCDTQDYYFTFDESAILKATPGETSRKIKGHARVETRGQVDWEGDLDCTANWGAVPAPKSTRGRD